MDQNTQMVIERPELAPEVLAGLLEQLLPRAGACCANPHPQLMYDTHLKRMVLQCMNCGAFC